VTDWCNVIALLMVIGIYVCCDVLFVRMQLLADDIVLHCCLTLSLDDQLLFF